MTVTVAVAGATGYAGGELLRILAHHPEVAIGAVTAGQSAGSRLGEHQPHLFPLADREVLTTTPENLADHDVVFLALPHGASGAVAAALPDDVLVIDCGADFRLADPAAWAKWYGGVHAGTWPYGLPELSGQRANLQQAKRIAVPGCYPTISTLCLAPAIAAGLIEPEVVIVAASGTSGAGKSLKTSLLASEVLGSASAYSVGGAHRHTPEIIQNLGGLSDERVTVSFTPVLVPMSRGILATCSASLAVGVQIADIQSEYHRIYDPEPFIQLMPQDQWPTTAAVLGSNNVAMGLIVDDEARRLVAVGAIDNLVKGTAGGAIQCMNIALGLAETAGLPNMGVAP